MGRRAVTQDFYDRILAAFREVRSYEGASRLAGCDVRSARRAWELGWPKKGMRPIQELLQDEQEAARRLEVEKLIQAAQERGRVEGEARAHAATAERDRELSVKRNQQWARSAETARGNVMALIVVQQAVLAGAVQKASEWKQQVLADSGPACAHCGRSAIDVARRARMLRDLTAGTREAIEALQLAQEVEQLALGQPQRIEGHVHVEVSADELRKRLDERRAKLLRAVERGAIPAEEAVRLGLTNGNGSNGNGTAPVDGAKDDEVKA